MATFGPCCEKLEARTMLSADHPHLREPFRLEQPIQAEDFDDGHEGIAYHITTPKLRRPVYRKSPAVIEQIAGKIQATFALAHLVRGEWFNYTIQIPATGLYEIDVRYRSGSGGTIHFEFGGTRASDPVLLAPTGRRFGHAIAQAHLVKNGSLLTLHMDDGRHSRFVAALDQFTITPVAAPDPLDNSFGENGLLIGSANFLTLQPSGKLIFVNAMPGGLDRYTRFDPDGARDPTFGGGGELLVSDNERFIEDPDGSFFFRRQHAGTPLDDGSMPNTFRHYTVDGALDLSFGDGGGVTINIKPSQQIVVQRNGRFVLAEQQDHHYLLSAFTPRGESDSSFGSGGVVDLALPERIQSSDLILRDAGPSIYIDLDDRITVTGQVETYSLPQPLHSNYYPNTVVEYRLSADGKLLSSGTQGAGYNESPNDFLDDGIYAWYISPTGQVWFDTWGIYDSGPIPGPFVLAAPGKFQIVRPSPYFDDLPAIVGFDPPWQYYRPLPGSAEYYDLILQSENKLLVVGRSNGQPAVARLILPSSPHGSD